MQPSVKHYRHKRSEPKNFKSSLTPPQSPTPSDLYALSCAFDSREQPVCIIAANDLDIVPTFHNHSYKEIIHCCLCLQIDLDPVSFVHHVSFVSRVKEEWLEIPDPEEGKGNR